MALPQWEYLTVPLVNPTEPEGVDDLNAAGLDGWEAVAAVQAQGSGAWHVVLKRPVQAAGEHTAAGYHWAGPGSYAEQT